MEKEFEQLKDKVILVTGGAGFVGSNLIEKLLASGAFVICFDNLSTGKESNVKDFFENKNFVFVKGDVNDLNDLSAVFEKHKIDYVFHYAATVGVLRTVDNPIDVLRDIDGIKYIAELSHKNKVKKVVFSSSSEVYGEPLELPEKEDSPLNLKLPYATVKLIGEQYLKAYYQTHGLKCCLLRFFNVYGPKQDSSAYGFVAGTFVKNAIKNEPLTVFGDGSQTRDFVYIEDNINASILALLSDETDNQSINIGAGKPTTILDLANHVIKISGNTDLKINFLPLRKDGEIKHRFPDVTKMERLLKYKPRYSLDEGLKKTFEWYRSNLN